MDDLYSAQHIHRRSLHGRKTSKHGTSPNVDSPLYDASEEDNDELLDDTISSSGVRNVHRRPTGGSPLGPNSNDKSPLSPTSGFSHQLPPHRQSRSPNAAKIQGAAISPHDSEGVDSPTYDGDVESSTAATPLPSTRASHYHQSHLSVSTLAGDLGDDGLSIHIGATTPTVANEEDGGHGEAHTGQTDITSKVISIPSEARTSNDQYHNRAQQSLAPGEPAPAQIPEDSMDPAVLTPHDIRAYAKAAIDGTLQPPRSYSPNQPPLGRPIRIYADGVYDIFHFGHALQLRQAKLSFESVHLMVGVCSDELCSEHKSRTVMTHAERCESVRHCRWVDEIIPEAPWVIDQEFLDKYNIDYVAHDDEPYKGSDGSEDVYQYVKSTGRFIPTRRTPGVSTSELLERIVAGYREGDWDAKLVKIGHPELASRAPSRAASRPHSRLDVKAVRGGSSSPTGHHNHDNGDTT